MKKLCVLSVIFIAAWTEGASAQCTCASRDPAAPCTATSLSRTRFGVEFEFAFSCDGGACACGFFATGDPWVAAINRDGEPVDAVQITRATPDGEAHGMMSNPPAIEEQGVLSGYGNYRAELNLMNQLPYDARPGESLFKMARRANAAECGTRGITEHGCAEVSEVLTVLAAVPEGNGRELFRPPFAAGDKPLFSLDRLRPERLPSLPQMDEDRADYADIVARWTVPHLSHYHQCSGCGEQHRAHAPHAAVPDYAAQRSLRYLDDVYSLFGTDRSDDRMPALVALVQRGIDIWGSWRAGVKWGSGAGQHLGYKPALAFFAAVYDDPQVLQDVRAIASDPEDSYTFQEDSQLFRGRSGVVIWGDGRRNCGTTATSDSVRRYFSGYRSEWLARRGGDGFDNKGTACDPYGYIDGPGGGPEPTNPRGRTYQGVSAAPHISYAFAQHLMPWLRYAAGDDEILEYADRYYRGRGIDGFEGGYWASPDPCAAHDPDESDDCDPWRGGRDCTNYGVTWGPRADDPSECVEHGGDPSRDGRWSELHGRGRPEIRGTVGRHWDALRDCADSEHASYPCEGLGAEVPDELPMATPDAGVSDAGVSDAGAPVADAAATDDGGTVGSEGGSGCAAAPGGGAAMLLALAAMALRRRRQG